MKILMTGGTGLVGQALTRELQRQGHQIDILKRDEVLTSERARDIEGVIHLAGENIAAHRWTKKRKQQLRDSRIQTAQALADVFKKRDTSLRFFISASAVGIYGDRGDQVLIETSPAGSDFLAKLCVEWEAAARGVPAERHVQLRFGVVLAPEGGFLAQVVPLFRKLGASRLGSGDQYFSWIHLNDLLRVAVAAVSDPTWVGAVNVVAPQPVTNAEMTKVLKEELKAFWAPPVPAFALKLLYGELATALLASQRVQPEVLKSMDWKFRYPAFREAIRACGIR